ncbi:hypothetical protein ACTFIW_002567 [Dictyostelium discoideum]
MESTPPRFGLDCRNRNKKDVNIRKQKEILKVDKLKKLEIKKLEDQKKLKEQEEKHRLTLIRLANAPPQTNSINNNNNNINNNIKTNRPPLIYGEDKDKKSLFPEPQDYDVDEPTYETSFCVKLGPNGVFQHELRFTNANARENSDIQKAIELSLKQTDVVIVKNPNDDIENDFVVFNEQPDEREKELEHWELMDECSSSLVNFVTTPYNFSELEFPRLASTCSTQMLKKNLNQNNPWLNSKSLIANISQK